MSTSLILLTLALAALIGADVLISRSKNRYARALYDHILTTLGLFIALTSTAMNALDYKLGWPWWNSDVGWLDVVVFGFFFPVILLAGGRDWPRRRAAYVRERDIRSGKLVRIVEDFPLGGRVETVLSADAAARREQAQQRRKDFPIGSS